MVAAHPDVAEVMDWLKAIPDPEIPALSIVDLGIVRDVHWSSDNSELVISITPTYSGCPALGAIAADIRSSIRDHGIRNFRLETQLSPAWTTDWMSEDAKRRLQAYGIAPPSPLITIPEPKPACPLCGSNDTELVSRFGSTACKAMYRCRACLEPFDAFKRH